jgi:hypothetical protein
MTDAALHGNGEPCEACALRRELQDLASLEREPVPCNVCKGSGRVPIPDAEIVRRTVEEARRIYWPAFAKRLQEAAGAPPEAL